ncbi:hypothetical protein F503_00578 [Ophiostoma piceae UAMH 11346]|uniref:Uncharacterized protein n=1 Tax=Ophiostoma piceae (strain UAMH 11346) TaxID=1262450 RepID=S3C7E4_OPHP1|nr:hypothetical protein F503_00578 [Ophiostoma piceae UAMH 11346]
MCRITMNLYDCPHYNRVLVLCEPKKHKYNLSVPNNHSRSRHTQPVPQRPYEQQHISQSRGKRYSKQLPPLPPQAAPQPPPKPSKKSFWSCFSSSSSTPEPIPRPRRSPDVQCAYTSPKPPKDILQYSCSLRKISVQTKHHRETPCSACIRKNSSPRYQSRSNRRGLPLVDQGNPSYYPQHMVADPSGSYHYPQREHISSRNAVSNAPRPPPQIRAYTSRFDRYKHYGMEPSSQALYEEPSHESLKDPDSVSILTFDDEDFQPMPVSPLEEDTFGFSYRPYRGQPTYLSQESYRSHSTRSSKATRSGRSHGESSKSSKSSKSSHPSRSSSKRSKHSKHSHSRHPKLSESAEDPNPYKHTAQPYYPDYSAWPATSHTTSEGYYPYFDQY